MFLYGRGTENWTLIYRLKAGYFTIKLYPQGSLVTVHLDSPKKIGTRYRIRTGVNAVKGHYPRPLDEPSKFGGLKE